MILLLLLLLSLPSCSFRHSSWLLVRRAVCLRSHADVLERTWFLALKSLIDRNESRKNDQGKFGGREVRMMIASRRLFAMIQSSHDIRRRDTPFDNCSRRLSSSGEKAKGMLDLRLDSSLHCIVQLIKVDLFIDHHFNSFFLRAAT